MFSYPFIRVNYKWIRDEHALFAVLDTPSAALHAPHAQVQCPKDNEPANAVETMPKWMHMNNLFAQKLLHTACGTTKEHRQSTTVNCVCRLVVCTLTLINR